jgi:carbon storage regulator
MERPRELPMAHRDGQSKKGVSAMLVLTRKLGEEIVIPSLDVTIRLVEIRGDKVRLGIEAPSRIAVHRKEVWDRIQEFQSQEEPGQFPVQK